MKKYSSRPGLTESIESVLSELVRPSTLRGVVVERPEVPMSRLIVTKELTASLQQVLVLADMCACIDTGSRVGVKAMFSGPSGTGKTMAARALATNNARRLDSADPHAR